MKTNQLLKSVLLISIGLLLFACQKSEVEVTLPKIINENMVLQRNQDVKIWGWASEKGKVTVTFNGQRKSTKVNEDLTWMVTLDPMEAGGPFEMMIMGKDTILFNNVLIGDVWVCSGQSNMEWTLSNTNNAAAEIAAANYPMIRLFDVPNNIQLAPAEDLPSGEWQTCSPETVANFSSIGYLFGRNLHKELDVPIGLISSNWGGTIVETWMSREICSSDPELEEMIQDIQGLDLEGIKKKKEEEMREMMESLGVLEEGIIDGKAVWAAPDLDLSGWKIMRVPGLWEGQGLTGVDGVVWYRREFTFTKEQAAKGATLNLGPIDDSDKTWINGVLVGETHDRYSDDRSYKIQEGITKEGINHLVVRVEDYRGGGGFFGDPTTLALKTAAGDVPLAGDWKYRVSAANISFSPLETISPNDKPTLLYNGMIHPIINYPILGVIWYQGESNAQNAFQYRTRFPNMIRDWRNKWENEEMGFYFVQLANFMASKPNPGGSAWAELREAQSMTLSLPKTGMAVAIDIGEADDIHPRNKQDVAYRLSLAALHDTYGKDIVYSGPVFKGMAVEGNKVTLEFDHAGSGLTVRDESGNVNGFALAGEDQQFYWASGKIIDGKVILWSEDVENPVSVRYAWADNPDKANLYNMEGLPAVPFRTDTDEGGIN